MHNVDVRQQAARQIVRATTGLDKMKHLVLEISRDQPGYYNANEALLNLHPEIRQAVLARTGGRRIKLSSGISTLPTQADFVAQAQRGIGQIDYYVNYSAPSGTYAAQEALRRIESALLTPKDEMIYPSNGIFITTGGTGAINLAFEYIRQTSPTASILVLGPSYYVFQFTARRLGIPCETIMAYPLQPSCETRFLPTPENVKASLTPHTKLLVVTQPSNPTGEYYSRVEIEQLIDLAREKDLLILSDTVFADLVYPEALGSFASFEEVAFGKNALERILTVRSYSKNYNLPGLRIGYLATSNPEIGRTLSFINERIMCCPATVYTDLITMVSLLQNIDIDMRRFPWKSVKKSIKSLLTHYEFGQGIHAEVDIEQVYWKYRHFMQKNLLFYAQNFDKVYEVLAHNAEAGCEKSVAFNTLVKIKDIPAGTNFFDFCVNLYLTTGIETQIGPCFGLAQSAWEQYLGFWLRVTYTLPPHELQEALTTLLIFRDMYLEEPYRFIHTGLTF